MSEISKPPYPYRSVGAVPVPLPPSPAPATRSARPTTKYGTRVPSSDVAKCCATVMPSASKNAGLDLTTSGAPASPGCSPSDRSESVVGVR
ncbi:Uncharacterised protein [Mycobacteroides abscessus]|nr:Uncharacterised protein [Mycobacteroides abscessus]